MADGFFYCQVDKNDDNTRFLDDIEKYSEEKAK